MQVSDLRQMLSGLLQKTEKSESVELTPGQVINAAVKSVNGKLATIHYRGIDLAANLEVDIPEGEQLKFLVAGEKDGQIILKLLTNLANAANIETGRELFEVASRLGLSEHNSNQALITEMMKQELPLTPDAAEKLSAFVKNGQITEQDFWVPVFMLKRGVSLTTENYQRMTALLTDMEYLHDDVKQLNQELSRLAANDPKSELGRLALKIGNLFTAYNLDCTQGQQALSVKLESLFRMLTGSASPEQLETGALVQQMPQLDQSGSAADQTVVSPGQNESNAMQAGEQVINDGSKATLSGKPEIITNAANLVKSNAPSVTGFSLVGNNEQASNFNDIKINNSSINNSNGDHSNANHLNAVDQKNSNDSMINPHISHSDGNKANVSIQSDSPLEGFLRSGWSHHAGPATENLGKGTDQSELLDLLHRLSAKLTDEQDGGYRELARLAGRVADRLDFLQNFNNHLDPGRENLIIVHSSVNFQQNSEPLRMIIRYHQDAKGSKRDFSSCNIEVKLNTAGLGAVKCDIRVMNRDLSVRFVTESDSAGRLLDSLGGALATRLEDMNYRVMIQPYQVQRQELKDIVPGRHSEIPGLFQINLQV